MQRGCFANSFCQRLCSGLSWGEFPYERAMDKLKAALSSPPPPAVGVRGTQAGPGRWHRSTFVTLLEVPFPEGAAKATLEVLPRRGQSTAAPGERQGLSEPLGATGTVHAFCWHSLCISVFIGISTALRLSCGVPPYCLSYSDTDFRYEVWNVESKQMYFR